jgi:periplasmic copper chaperone A
VSFLGDERGVTREKAVCVMKTGWTGKKMRRMIAIGAMTVAALAMAACSGGSGSEVRIDNAWVKSTEGGMTAVFGEVVNPTGEDLALVGGSSPVAGMVEVHEVADGVMRQKTGGVVIFSGETATLSPGGDHLMLMNLTGSVLAGETIEVTFAFDDGSEVTVEVLAKDFAGAEEEYEHSGDSGHGEMGEDEEMSK